MRRIAVWLLGTVTVLVLLFSYHTSTSSRFAPSQAAVAGRDTTDDAPDLPESGTFDGDPVVTRFGVVQVRITVADGRIASVDALQVPNRDRHDVLINERAVPILNAEAVEHRAPRSTSCPAPRSPGRATPSRCSPRSTGPAHEPPRLGRAGDGDAGEHPPARPGGAGSEAERAVAAAYAELVRLDGLFSTYRPESPLSRRRRGDLAAGSDEPLFAEVEGLCAVAAERTGGAFTAWLPDDAGELRYDPTGLVKGWAVDRAARELTGLTATSWSVNAGGDVLVGRHHHVPPEGADAAPWRIGVEDPRDRTRMVAVVPLSTGAVATSGTAARGAHLYDPVAQQAVDRVGSMTVVADTLLWADVWATALFVGGDAAREAFARNAPGAQMFAA